MKWVVTRLLLYGRSGHCHQLYLVKVIHEPNQHPGVNQKELEYMRRVAR